MNRISLRVSFISATILAAFSLHAQFLSEMPPSLEGVDLYELIGIDEDEYQKEVTDAIEAVKLKIGTILEKDKKEREEAKGARDFALDRYQSLQKLGRALEERGDDTEFHRENREWHRKEYEKADQRYREFEKKYNRAFENALIKDLQYNNLKGTIGSACKKTQKDLRDKLKKLEEEIEKYPPGTQPLEVDQDMKEAKRKFSQAEQACSFLLDPESRAQYDIALASKIPTELAYERARQAVEGGLRLTGTGTRIFLNKIIGELLSQVEIPGPALKLFNQNLALTDIHVLPKPWGKGIKYYVGFTGTTEFNNFALKIDVYVIWDTYGKRRWSISVATPDNYRLTNMFPSLKSLNWMIFPKGKFLVSSFNGTDAEGFSFKKGLNFKAEWDIFSGPLAFFKRLQNAAPKLEGLVFEAAPIELMGQIPSNPFLTRLTARVPVYFGIDFTKIKKLPHKFTSVINKLTTDALELKIRPYQRRKEEEAVAKQEKFKQQPRIEGAMKKAEQIGVGVSRGFIVEAQTGAILHLGTQRDPIKFLLSGLVIPPSLKYPQGFISLSGQLRNMIEFGWLAIGNAAIVIDFDLAALDVLILFGIPFSGFL